MRVASPTAKTCGLRALKSLHLGRLPYLLLKVLLAFPGTQYLKHSLGRRRPSRTAQKSKIRTEMCPNVPSDLGDTYALVRGHKCGAEGI